MMLLRIQGKDGKLRYLPLHPGTAEVIDSYLEVAGHGDDAAALNIDIADVKPRMRCARRPEYGPTFKVVLSRPTECMTG